MTCCGGRKKVPEPETMTPSTRSAIIEGNSDPSLRWIEYVGGNHGNSTWIGPVTRTAYIFGGARKIGQVHVADLKGMLNIRKNTRPQFRAYNPKPPAVPASKAIEANPGAEPTKDPVSIGEERAPLPPTKQELDITPAALVLANISGVDLSSIMGTGANGRILKRDVEGVLINA